ncbi:hypothetical protein BOTNAR_0248g00180 [Botryotinia narcissicola]|uniref:Zn(2)-C6 fungal-type domain-containing protein n=1 Tax=Botryotinia narcissicola TaxID=278944 RepID=A0A4Z1I789_9HELO|nr:hypothetical protein BOTNAR_0248g00180 [Botryotinia narcissicola]
MDNTSGSNVDSPIAVRSNRGCWTCRIRKKKCDEIQPGCSRCKDVNVECHYGPKPKWIDDPKFAKEELEKIKAIVAASASKKRAAFRARKNTGSISSVPKSPKSPSTSTSTTTKIAKKGDDLPSVENVASMSTPPIEMDDDKPIEPKSPFFPKWIEDQEASLMMHYLDHVFFIQFRFHTPSLSSGRGWLLSLLTKTKPLYHAALSLSAFHRQSLLLEQESGQAEIDYLHELQHHYDLALKGLQDFIQINNKNASEQGAFDGNIQILAFSNGSIPGPETLLTSSQCFNIPGAGSPESILSESLVSRDSAALDFFTGAIIWMDALPGSSKSDHKIQLASIMGCENWVMIMISEIAWLGTWKRKHESDSTIDFKQQLIFTEKNIRGRLESKNSETLEELHALRSIHRGTPPFYVTELYNKHTILLITHIFACASLIYLQMVITDNLLPEDVDMMLHNTINAMRMIPNPQMFRGLVWPLSVAGCLASSKQDQEFFRETSRGAATDSRSFGNSSSAFEILEKSWELQRREGRLIDCTTTIREMGSCILLV